MLALSAGDSREFGRPSTHLLLVVSGLTLSVMITDCGPSPQNTERLEMLKLDA